MSLVGGAAGGGVFYGISAFKGDLPSRKSAQNDLIYLVSNGKTDELIKEINTLEKKGKLGNTRLSATRMETDAKGNLVYLTTTKDDVSQNQYIADKLRSSVYQLDAILNSTGTKLSDPQLFEQMVMKE
jgi:hypothetical protein